MNVEHVKYVIRLGGYMESEVNYGIAYAYNRGADSDEELLSKALAKILYTQKHLRQLEEEGGPWPDVEGCLDEDPPAAEERGREQLQAIIDSPYIANSNGKAHWTVKRGQIVPAHKQPQEYRNPTWRQIIARVKHRYGVDWE